MADVPGPQMPDGPVAGAPAPDAPAGALEPTPAPQPRPPPIKPPKHSISADPVLSGPTVPGLVAQILPSGKAAAPRGAPRAVRVMIWTANRLIGLRYRWGGGHMSFQDRSYDCSGAVSYALHAAGALANPLDSRSLEHWGQHGPGRWVTVYTKSDHVWMIVAGLRLDTSPVADPAGLTGPRWRPAQRPTAHFHVRRPPGL